MHIYIYIECKKAQTVAKLSLSSQFVSLDLSLSLSLSVCLIDLRFNISVENAVSMHVFYGLKQLINVELDTRLWQISRSTLDRLIQIHFHELEDESESARRLVTVQIELKRMQCMSSTTAGSSEEEDYSKLDKLY